jgi:cytochrome bd-type quinol oxidase subunit 2
VSSPGIAGQFDWPQGLSSLVRIVCMRDNPLAKALTVASTHVNSCTGVTPATDAAIARRWFSWSDLPLLAPIPVITALLVIWEWRSPGKRSSEVAPFVTAVGIFALSYAGIAISLWPMIVPHRYSLWEAASSTSTQVFLLVGAVFLLPIIFMYTAWSYWVFRGKVRGEVGYQGYQDARRSVSVLNDVAARNHRTNLVPGAHSDERE